MKILEANAGPLTNFEVFEFLRSKDAVKDPTLALLPNIASEYKVFEYLEKSGCKHLTREVINEFLEKCKSFKLSKAEMLNIINIMPKSAVELFPIIEACDTRDDDESTMLNALVAIVKEVLLAGTPSPPPVIEEIEVAHEENGVEADK
ncbi:unnamed protein product [Cuscuta campestris]|uniref:DNA-directed RNA polymerase III subunit RPC9 n=1 Tax=Cuscuta campestris TaxID=132261 RepID=A0A484NN67_9ASTE|nr:unnamed protein product [Cuscuta campestris]